ncbi:hypothetical protein CXF85_07440 [Colwellia sp. 75C3]|uniref:hypothetical protein n=1 Tax=Colwellia sp. 75C3 TaxID=888425 RepID=UPI000C32D29F|nr:hypothetical protein [Colwellia sp. 75C3]PKG85406.1 hypothetical protein CXF85_07440 [Colwellia sp. 75C3]
MFFVLVITVVFVFISIYFFFRAEKLQRQLISQQRESLATRKENKLLVESITLVATREQEFSKAKLQRLKAYAKANDDEQLLLHTELISPLINNYSIVFRECLKGKGRLKSVSQKCFANQDSSAYKKFVALIVTSDKKLKRYWSSDNLNGFLFLVDALLTIDEGNSSRPIKDKKSNCHS